MSEVDIEISENEYVGSYKLSQRPSLKKITIYAFFVFFLAIFAIINKKYRSVAVGALVGGIVSNLASTQIIYPWLVRRNYRNYPLIKKPCRISFDTTGIIFSDKDGRSVLEWKDIHKWRENNEFILIYLSPTIYHIVPKKISNKGFAVSSFVNFLRDHVGQAI